MQLIIDYITNTLYSLSIINILHLLSISNT